MSSKSKGQVSDPPVQKIDNIQIASAASSAASPAGKSGVNPPAYLYRFEHAVIEGGKTKETVWIETKAASEKEAWDNVPGVKLAHEIPDAVYTGNFKIN